MGKFKIILFTILVALVGCTKDSEELQSYTLTQLKVFNVFNGEWYDTQFSNIVNGQHINPTRIIFGDNYSAPIDIYEGTLYKFTSHGNCRFYLPFDGVEEEYIQCSYYVSPDGTTLDLHNKSNNKLYHYYNITIESDTKVRLHQNGLSLPYIFVKLDKATK